MSLSINNELLVVCIFYFFIASFSAYLFRQANLFFKIFLAIFICTTLALIQDINRIEVTLSALFGFLLIYVDWAIELLAVIKLWLENFFAGLLSMIRKFFRFIFQPIANFFAWFYNLLSRIFGWNKVFIPLGQKAPKKIYLRRQAGKNSPRRQQQPVSRGNAKQGGQRSFADRQKQDSIKQAKAQIKQARELAKQKEQQQNHSGGDRSY